MLLMKRDIKSYFEGVLDNIDIILKSDFYKIGDKEYLFDIKNIFYDWYNFYVENNSLNGIDSKKIEYLDLEITDFFDKYVKLESVKENYSERLLYDFGCLEKLWENEILNSNKN